MPAGVSLVNSRTFGTLLIDVIGRCDLEFEFFRQRQKHAIGLMAALSRYTRQFSI